MEAQRQSEQRYREVFEHTSDGIFVLDVGDDGKFRVREMNPAERGERASQAGRPAAGNDDLWSAEIAEHFDRNNRACVAAGTPMSFEDAVELPTGPTSTPPPSPPCATRRDGSIASWGCHAMSP